MHIVAALRARERRYDHTQADRMQAAHHTRDSLAAASQAASGPTILQQVVLAAHDIPDTLSYQAAAQEPSF
jgi:hypothetical protein